MQPGAPLEGRTVVVTRPRKQAAGLAEGLRSKGAEVLEAPVIRVEPPTDPVPLDTAINRLREYDWVIFTSVNGVQAFFDRMQARGSDLSPTTPPRLAAIGPATASALEARGWDVQIVPRRFVAEEVFETLRRSTPLDGTRFLLPRADIARKTLPELLRQAGAIVDVVVAYRTIPVDGALREIENRIREGRIDVVTFTSGSTVRGFVNNLSRRDELRGRFVAASIGPITSRALRDAGLEPGIEARVYTVDGLIEAIEHYYTAERQPGG